MSSVAYQEEVEKLAAYLAVPVLLVFFAYSKFLGRLSTADTAVIVRANRANQDNKEACPNFLAGLLNHKDVV